MEMQAQAVVVSSVYLRTQRQIAYHGKHGVTAHQRKHLESRQCVPWRHSDAHRQGLSSVNPNFDSRCVVSTLGGIGIT